MPDDVYSQPLVAWNDGPSDYPLYEATYDKGLSWSRWDPFAAPGRRLMGPSWGDPSAPRYASRNGRTWIVQAGRLVREI